MCIRCCVLYEKRLKLFYIEYTFWKCEIREEKKRNRSFSTSLRTFFRRGGEIARSERVKLDSVGRTAQFPLRGGYLETLERILLHDIVRNDVLSSRVGGVGQEQ